MYLMERGRFKGVKIFKSAKRDLKMEMRESKKECLRYT
jgi:hypothetical protein